MFGGAKIGKLDWRLVWEKVFMVQQPPISMVPVLAKPLGSPEKCACLDVYGWGGGREEATKKIYWSID